MIRTSKHTTSFSNKNKLLKLKEFIHEYQKSLQYYLDYLFNNIVNYECPKFISTKNNYPHNTKLSQRVLKCASGQACGIIRSNTEKPRKVLYRINKLKEEGKDFSKLQKWLDNYKFSKPTLPQETKAELNSICCNLQKKDNFYFLQLSSLGKCFGKIRIPLKIHKQSKKWESKGKILNSFLVSNKFINIRYEIIKEECKKEGKIVGADQGKNTCLSLSDGQITKVNNHGYDLNNILNILTRKKKGSNAFKKAQEHRKNYINWSINQLNLTNIKQVNLEKVRNIRKGKNSSRYMSHWTYTLIKEKLFRFCEEQKVSVKEQNCTYRSQRCNKCGLVREDNRQGKIYCCNICGYVGDADVNASINHEIDLPDVSHLRHKGYNEIGFYWLETGIYDLCGKEFTVPYVNKT